MSQTDIDAGLREVLAWAQAKVDTGQEPPWAWYQYMKLIEAIEAIQAGRRAVTQPPEGSRQSEAQAGNDPRQQGEVVELKTPQHHRRNIPTLLPM